MGVLDNGRVWQCNVLISDLYFGDPTRQNSITTGSTTGYTNSNIKNWKITDTMSANGDVAFGSTGSKALNLELFGLSSKSFGTGAIIGVMLTGPVAPKYWYFFVDTAKWTVDCGSTTRYSASVTAYDAMYYASGKISSVALPSSIEALIESGKATITNCKTIAQYCIRHARYDLIRTRAGELYSETGLEKYRTYSNMLDSNLDDAYVSGTATMDWVCSDNVGKVTIGALPYSGEISITSAMTGRTLLGRMAAMAGKRAYCNNNSSANIGAIEFDNLISGSYSAISTGDVYDNGFVAEGKKSFQYFTNGTVSYGKKTSNGFSTMAINCPDMTQAKINSLGSANKGTEYEIGSVKFRGDPTLISGMRLNAPDASGTIHNMVCTKVVTCYDGGLYQQLYSEGKSDSDIEFEMNSAAQKAEDIVDEGGGGGTSNLLYYSETENPNAATIAVDGNSIVTNADGITVTGNIFADSIGNKSTNTIDGAKINFGDINGNNSTHLSTITLAYDNSTTKYINTILDWANADKMITHIGGQTQHYYNALYIDELNVGIDSGGVFSEVNGQYGGIKSVGDVQIGGTFGIQTSTANLSVTGDTTLTGDIYLPSSITNIQGNYLRLRATTKLDISGTTEITGRFKVNNQYSQSYSDGVDITDDYAMLYNQMGLVGVDNDGLIWVTPSIIMTNLPPFDVGQITDGLYVTHTAGLLIMEDIDSGTHCYIDFLSKSVYFD
ncbi:MAG: hypothetical protein IJK60_05520 [Clostridia bacterium]|nr:hypothetical protein [Clostridia bacterium]